MGIGATPRLTFSPSLFFFFFFCGPSKSGGGRLSHDAGELRRSFWSTGNYRTTHHPPPGLWLCLLSVFRCACSESFFLSIYWNMLVTIFLAQLLLLFLPILLMLFIAGAVMVPLISSSLTPSTHLIASSQLPPSLLACPCAFLPSTNPPRRFLPPPSSPSPPPSTHISILSPPLPRSLKNA